MRSDSPDQNQSILFNDLKDHLDRSTVESSLCDSQFTNGDSRDFSKTPRKTDA
jgi:hypothetical protein